MQHIERNEAAAPDMSEQESSNKEKFQIEIASKDMN